MVSNKQHWRYVSIRAMTALAGDIAMATAVAGACSWLIESATLGLFLAFLTWLLGFVLALALSEYVVHPAVQWAMADDKLDRGLTAAGEFAGWATNLAAQVQQPTVRAWLDRLSGAVHRWRTA